MKMNRRFLHLASVVLSAYAVLYAAPARAIPGDFAHCTPNYRYQTAVDLGTGGTFLTPSFSLQPNDRIFFRASGGAGYDFDYQVQRDQGGGSWVTERSDTRGGSDGAVQRITDTGGTYRVRVSAYSGSGRVWIDVAVVWHENTSCRVAWDIQPNTRSESIPVDGCFGAVGPNCQNPGGAPSETSDGWMWMQNAPGSHKHDSCCSATHAYYSGVKGHYCWGDQAGQTRFDGVNTVWAENVCNSEMGMAENDTLYGLGQWRYFNPAVQFLIGYQAAARDTGDVYQYPTATSIKFSGGSKLDIADINRGWCAGGSTRGYRCCAVWGCGGVKYDGAASCGWGEWVSWHNDGICN